jgi:hypothetical protein
MAVIFAPASLPVNSFSRDLDCWLDAQEPSGLFPESWDAAADFSEGRCLLRGMSRSLERMSWLGRDNLVDGEVV